MGEGAFWAQGTEQIKGCGWGRAWRVREERRQVELKPVIGGVGGRASKGWRASWWSLNHIMEFTLNLA